ncbi:MAG: hypothetical protein AAFN12_10675 [Cyanobacteria bacterium J06560_2]
MDKKVLAGVGIGGVIALVLGGKAVASHVAAKEVDKAISEVSEFVEIDYKKVEQSIIGRGTTVKDVVMTPVGSDEPIKVNEVVLYDYDQKDNVPTYMNFALKGVSMDLAGLEENGANLAELGYEGDLSGDFATEYAYDEENRTIRLKKMEMGADDLGSIEMNMSLANISLDEDAIASLPFSLFGAEFQDAKIVYKDDSFVERILESGAKAEGISVKEAKEALIEDLEAESGELPEDFVREMSDFIKDPDSFTLTFSPEEPVPLGSFLQVGSNEDIIELLNVEFDS